MKKLNHNRLAEGEVTGHAHRVIGKSELFEADRGIDLSAKVKVVIRHEEHGPITLVPGDYETGIVREMDHFAEEARNVID